MKLLLITGFLIFSYSLLNAQSWISNNPAWIYKYENIESLEVVKNCVDGNLKTFTKSKTQQSGETWNLTTSIYFNLGYVRFVKEFKINCQHMFPFRTIDNFQLYCSNSPDGPWDKALTQTMPESYSEEANWYQYSFEMQKAQYWKLTLKPRYSAISFFEIGFGSAGVPFNLTIPDTIINIDQPMEIPVITSLIKKKNNVVSFQMRVNFDATMMEYKDFNLKGTIVTGGVATVNEMTSGTLIISYMRATPIEGSGSVMNLLFKPLQLGKSDILIYDALYNIDTIININNGGITINGTYGDIDQNGIVQAFDASVALQYSVGLDPIEVDPLPWDAWRTAVANVDGRIGVTANDASLILQRSANLISQFPAEEMYQNDQSFSDVKVNQTDNELIFSSSGKLYGLNIKVNSLNKIKLSKPEFLFKNMLSVTNIENEIYNIGVCSATPMPDATNILKIPFTIDETCKASAEIEMIVNQNSSSKILLFFIKK